MKCTKCGIRFRKNQMSISAYVDMLYNKVTHRVRGDAMVSRQCRTCGVLKR